MRKQNWDILREYIAKNKYLSLLFFFLILLVGMVTAAIVNYISVNPLFARAAYVGGTFGLVSITLGIIIFSPFLKFRFKYNFLSDYDELVANFIYILEKRSENLMKLSDGIIAVQLFQVERETLPEEINYKFNKIFEKKTKTNKVDKLKPKELSVPIQFIDWIYRFNTNEKISAPNFLENKEILQQLLFDYVRNGFHQKASDEFKDKNPEEIDQLFVEKIKNWNLEFKKKTLYKSVHYLTLFKQVEPHKIYLGELTPDEEKISPIYISSLMDTEKREKITDVNIYSHEYSNKNKKKKFRVYFNLLFELNSLEEGKQQFVLLVIADKRFIPDTSSVSQIYKHMLQ